MRTLCAALLFTPLAATASEQFPPADLWFPVGESLHYEVHWIGLHVADHHVTTSWTNHDGRDLIAIRHRARSNGVVEKLYPVDIQLETLVEPATFLPVVSSKRASEGRKRQNEQVTFDYAAGFAQFTNLVKQTGKTIPIDPETRDLVTAMYWIRKQPLAHGQTNRFKVLADDKVYDLSLAARETESVKLVRYGKVASTRIDPEAAFDGLFTRKGKLTVWVSNDARQLCTRLVGQVPVASINVTLREVSGPGEDRWVKPAQLEGRTP